MRARCPITTSAASAFSLWPEEDVGTEFPPGFVHSPEPLFAEVVRAYPRLKGKFPEWFTGNYSTGVYIPAEKVSTVRQWLEGVLAELSKGDRRMYRGLLAMLRAAEEKQLAFWEATDLAIPITGEVPGDPELMTADYLRNTPGSMAPAEKTKLPVRSNRVGGHGDIHILSHAGPDTTVIVDVDSWPPQFMCVPRNSPGSADHDRENRWLFVSRAGPENYKAPVRGRLLTDLRSEPDLVVHAEDNGAEVKVNDGFLIAGRMVLIPDASVYEPGTKLSAWIQDGARMRPVPAWLRLRSSGAIPETPGSSAGGGRLAGGTEVLVWDGDGYEWDGRQFQKTFPLGLKNPYDKLTRSRPVRMASFSSRHESFSRSIEARSRFGMGRSGTMSWLLYLAPRAACC